LQFFTNKNYAAEIKYAGLRNLEKSHTNWHFYFWTIVPEKTQCGKIGATNEDFIIM